MTHEAVFDAENDVDGQPREPQYPWEAAYTGVGQWHARLPTKPLFTIFDDAAVRYPHRPCIEFMGRSYDFSEVANLIERAAAGLQRIGVVKGTRVGLCLPNSPYSVICYFAILKAGGTVVNINPLYAEREIDHLVRTRAWRSPSPLTSSVCFRESLPI